MRNYLVRFIDNLISGLISLRHWILSSYADPAAADFLVRWKAAYPETFGKDKVITVVTTTEPSITNEELNTTFPPEESQGFSGH